MTEPAVMAPEWREVYWIPNRLYDPPDPKPGRPAVVVEVVSGPAGRARVVTRTRDERRGENGVHHDAEPDLLLSDEGWFTDEYWIDLVAFTDPPMHFRGALLMEAMERVETMFS